MAKAFLLFLQVLHASLSSSSSQDFDDYRPGNLIKSPDQLGVCTVFQMNTSGAVIAQPLTFSHRVPPSAPSQHLFLLANPERPFFFPVMRRERYTSFHDACHSTSISWVSPWADQLRGFVSEDDKRQISIENDTFEWNPDKQCWEEVHRTSQDFDKNYRPVGPPKIIFKRYSVGDRVRSAMLDTTQREGIVQGKHVHSQMNGWASQETYTVRWSDASGPREEVVDACDLQPIGETLSTGPVTKRLQICHGTLGDLSNDFARRKSNNEQEQLLYEVLETLIQDHNVALQLSKGMFTAGDKAPPSDSLLLKAQEDGWAIIDSRSSSDSDDETPTHGDGEVQCAQQ